jgi:hypothetical protein
MTETARRVIDEGAPEPVIDDHRGRLGRLVDALKNGVVV